MVTYLYILQMYTPKKEKEKKFESSHNRDKKKEKKRRPLKTNTDCR